MASLGDSRFYFGFSAGAILSDGILVFVDDPDYFDLLDVGGLVNTMLSELGDESISGLYETAKTLFPYPNLRLALGVRLFAGIETLLTFSIIPQAIADIIVGFVPDMAGLELSHMNIGVRLRKTLLQDTGGFPALSVGAGYNYSDFNFKFPLEFTQPISGQDLNLAGDISLATGLHTAGVDVALSKRLAFFIPFISISGWYQMTNLVAAADFQATLGPVEAPLLDETIAPEATRLIQDLSFLLRGGFELKLGPIHLVPEATYNLGTGFFSADIGLRFQF